MNVKEYISNFGWKIFCIKAVRKNFYDNYSPIGIKLCLINENIIKKYLSKNIVEEIKKLPNNESVYINAAVPKNNIIWTMWWQGLNNAPKIVKACINNLKRKNPTKEVIVITKDNYQNYVQLDSRIIQSMKKEKISITHFSDIYRTNLLYLYGGIWIDSTVWATKTIDKGIFEKNFYSINTGIYTNDPSHGRWTTFFLEATAGSKVLNFVRKCFDIYCKKYDLFLDYILFDYFIALAMEENKDIKQIINSVPLNNEKVFELEKKMNQNEAIYNQYSNVETYLYKLTYKKFFKEKDMNNKPTVFYKIIKSK